MTFVFTILSLMGLSVSIYFSLKSLKASKKVIHYSQLQIDKTRMSHLKEKKPMFGYLQNCIISKATPFFPAHSKVGECYIINDHIMNKEYLVVSLEYTGDESYWSDWCVNLTTANVEARQSDKELEKVVFVKDYKKSYLKKW